MAVTADAVKELRERTGLPMMECKRALTSADGDIERAIDALRKAGAKAQDKLADRNATEGKVQKWLSGDRKQGAMLVLKCETEPVTKNDLYLALAKEMTEALVKHKPATKEDFLALALTGGTVAERIRDLVNQIRENFQLGRFARFDADAIVDYVHFDGKKGALVAFKGAAHSEKIEALGRDICMHIVFNKPKALKRDDMPKAEVDKEREILVEAARTQNPNKPAEILKKIAEGKLGSYFAANCLLEQPFIKDASQTVEQYVKASGLGVTVASFCYIASDI